MKFIKITDHFKLRFGGGMRHATILKRTDSSLELQPIGSVVVSDCHKAMTSGQ